MGMDTAQRMIPTIDAALSVEILGHRRRGAIGSILWFSVCLDLQWRSGESSFSCYADQVFGLDMDGVRS